MVGTAYCDDEGLAEADEDEVPGLFGVLIDEREGLWGKGWDRLRWEIRRSQACWGDCEGASLTEVD